MLFAMIAGICFAVLIILLLLYVLPMFFMHPLASGKIEGTDIIAVKNRINNLFFISIGNESDRHVCTENADWIVIDAGSDAVRVKREMERMSIDRNRVKAVFLTHTD